MNEGGSEERWKVTTVGRNLYTADSGWTKTERATSWDTGGDMEERNGGWDEKT